jgi:multicomponent Na+:H+ antiporter subunit D
VITLGSPLAIAWIGATLLVFFDGRRPWVAWAGVLVCGLHIGALGVLAFEVWEAGALESVTGGWAQGVGIRLRADALGMVFALISSSVLLVALVHEALRGVRTRAFPALVLFLAAGLTGLFLTADIFNFFVFFELSMISAYVLSVYGEERKQIGGALIFAVVNLLGSFLFLIAVGAIYHVTGTLDMRAIATRFGDVEAASAVMIAVTVFVAFGVKLGLFPFHFWLPPLYAGARPAVAAILAGALANIGSYGLIRFGAGILPNELEFGSVVIMALGAASIVYGSAQALSRRAVGEVLAYSAIGQAGYILVALAVGGPVGYTAAVLYSVVNALNKVLLFLAIGLRGWLVGAAFVVGGFSVAGVPPTAGFFAKVAMFQAGLEAGQPVILLALIFLGSALSFVYMFQIYQHEYWRGGQAGAISSRVRRSVVVVLALIVIGLGVWPEPMLELSLRAAAVLPGGTP